MKKSACSIALTALLLPFLGQGADKATSLPAATEAATPAKPNEAATAPAVSKEEAAQEALEAKFKATMAHATMSGRWCLAKDGKLEAEQEDKYTIVGVTKLFGDNWVVRARIQYAKHDITAPIPVKVKWAGDTPVITVDGFGLPGGTAAYSARVLIYGDSYAGTWSAGDHGGLMSGLILREKE